MQGAMHRRPRPHLTSAPSAKGETDISSISPYLLRRRHPRRRVWLEKAYLRAFFFATGFFAAFFATFFFAGIFTPPFHARAHGPVYSTPRRHKPVRSGAGKFDK